MPTASLTQTYPTGKEVYAQNFRATQDRGFGILLAWLDLGKLEPDEPGWARVELVGEEYNTLLLEIYPQSIEPFEDPERYAEDLVPPDASVEYRQQVLARIRAGHEQALQSGRFIQLDTDHVGADEVEHSIRTHLPKLFPELTGLKLYVVTMAELEPWAEYWSEVEEAVRGQYGLGLPEFLESRKSLILSNQ